MSLSTHDIRPNSVAPDGAVKPRTVVVGYDGASLRGVEELRRVKAQCRRLAPRRARGLGGAR